MLVLDTDHVSELGYGTPAGLRLRDRLLASGEDIATTIVTVEEQLRGWLAEIHRLADPHRQIPAYQRLHERIEFFARWTVLPWDTAAAELFLNLRQQGRPHRFDGPEDSLHRTGPREHVAHAKYERFCPCAGVTRRELDTSLTKTDAGSIKQLR